MNKDEIIGDIARESGIKVCKDDPIFLVIKMYESYQEEHDVKLKDRIDDLSVRIESICQKLQDSTKNSSEESKRLSKIFEQLESHDFSGGTYVDGKAEKNTIEAAHTIKICVIFLGIFNTILLLMNFF